MISNLPKATKDKQQLAGKAYLLFQKFLTQNAYRFIDCCPRVLAQTMEEELNAATKENPTKQITNTFFDEALRIAEEKMLEDLFTPFFNSTYFAEYPRGL
jgi:hypothetical protein